MKTLNEQFRALVKGSTHKSVSGVSGTNRDVRSAFWELFRAEYSDSVLLNVDGVGVRLKANHSISGKSTSYFAAISRDQYFCINLSYFGLSKDKAPYLSLNNGELVVHGGGKYYRAIPNDVVTIE